MEGARKTVGQRNSGRTAFHTFLPKLDPIRWNEPSLWQKEIVESVWMRLRDEPLPQERKHPVWRET